MDTLKERALPARGSQVVVAMSGGVDSSLVAALMVERGCRVTGVTMRVYDAALSFPEGHGNGCYGPHEEEDEERCRRLCGQLGMDYRVIDLSAAYTREVLDYFRAEYRSGRTANPCLRCNELVKLGLLPQELERQGVSFDWFATGHYARILEAGPHAYLAPAADPQKDQSYFLQRLSRAALARLQFPLGGLSKRETFALARERGLEAAEQAESQDFIAREDWDLLFAQGVGDKASAGEIVDQGGRILGTHPGIERFTIGQRRGVGVSVGSEPLYVLALDAPRKRVVVGPERELFATALRASESVWAPGFGPQEAGTEPFRAWVKIRLASPPSAALVTPKADGSVEVRFDNAQRAITPGQSAAFYVPAAYQASDGGSAVAPFADGVIDDAVSERSTRRTFVGTVLAGGAVIDSVFR